MTEDTKNSGAQTAKPSSEAACYVAMLDHTEQVGYDQSQTFREAKTLNGTETIDELMAWGKKWMEQPQILIVPATD